MRRWWLAIALLLSVGVNVGILATLAVGRHRPDRARIERSERPPDAPPRGELPPRALARLVDHLGLEGAQRERFLEVQRAFFHEAIAARRRRFELQRQLRSELTAERPDRARAEALVEELGRVQTGMEKALVKSVLDSREILTPEQERRYLRVLGHLRSALHEGGEGAGSPLGRPHGPPPPP